MSEATGTRRQTRSSAGIRLVPPAVTPLSPSDLAAGAAGQFRGTGRAEFRDALRSFLDGHSAGTYTSFRRALAACLLELAESGEGNTVLVPSFCSSDYPDAIEGAGLALDRYDVDPTTLSADVSDLDSLPEETLAVIVVNVLGYSSPMAEIAELCDQQDVFLVEALGYSLGSAYEGARLGTFGDCSVLNFQQGKPIPVGGGMVISGTERLTFDDAGREAVRPNAGMLGGYTLFGHPTLYGLYDQVGKPLVARLGQAERVSTHPESKLGVAYDPPFKTLSNFQGTVGYRSFQRLADHRRQRARTANYYASALGDLPGITHLDAIEGLTNHQFVRYPMLVESPDRRNALLAALEARGIQATAMYDWPKIDPDTFPGGARLQQQLITLPTHPYVDREDRQRTVQAVRDVVYSS